MGEKEKVEAALARIDHHGQAFIQEAYSRLFYHSLFDSESKIDSEKREQKGKRYTLGISKRIRAFRASLNGMIVYLLNSSSSGVLLSRRYLAEKEHTYTNSTQILDLVDELLPEEKIYNKVPVFYRNLLSSASTISDEFWVPRNREFGLLREASQRHRRGIGGAVMIKGEHGAGKTTLSRYAATHLFKRRNIFWIDPPPGGSDDLEVFLSVLQKQVARLNDFDSIFDSLPLESMLVINNLELWWERRAGGDKVLLKLIELIRQYGNKVLFVMNCNIHAFNLIKKIIPT